MTRKSKKIKIGNTFIGGDSPILVQSMLNVPAEDIEGSVKQAVELEKAGCQIIRFAIPNKDALALVEPIKNAVSVPLVADIHFDYKLALGAAERGIDKIRINPGNIGSEDRVKAVADICNQKGLPIRIGVNSGSQNTVRRHPRQWSSRLCITHRFLKNSILTISLFQSNLQMSTL